MMPPDLRRTAGRLRARARAGRPARCAPASSSPCCVQFQGDAAAGRPWPAHAITCICGGLPACPDALHAATVAAARSFLQHNSPGGGGGGGLPLKPGHPCMQATEPAPNRQRSWPASQPDPDPDPEPEPEPEQQPEPGRQSSWSEAQPSPELRSEKQSEAGPGPGPPQEPAHESIWQREPEPEHGGPAMPLPTFEVRPQGRSLLRSADCSELAVQLPRSSPSRSHGGCLHAPAQEVLSMPGRAGRQPGRRRMAVAAPGPSRGCTAGSAQWRAPALPRCHLA